MTNFDFMVLLGNQRELGMTYVSLAYVKSITGPKGKIVTGYAVLTDGTEVARYRNRHEGKGNWRFTKSQADDHATSLNAKRNQMEG